MATENDVILSKETISILKKMFEVNMSLLIQPNENFLRSRHENKRLAVSAPITETFPCQFALYDVQQFIKVVDIIKDPILNFDDPNVIAIRSDDGKQNLKYVAGEPSQIKNYFEKEPTIKDIVVTAEVTDEQFKSVRNAAQVMGLKYIGFRCDGEVVSLIAFNRNNGDDNTTNMFSIDVGESDTPFNMFYGLTNGDVRTVKDEGDLTFEITQGKVSRVKCESGKTFWIAMDAKSTYGSV